MLYVDTSAYAKRYLPAEEHHDACVEMMMRTPEWATSRLTSVEGARAIHLAAATRGEALREIANFDADLMCSILIDVDRTTLAIARDVAQETGIKASDAVHIASALRIQDAQPRFFTYDDRQARAAERVGLTLAR